MTDKNVKLHIIDANTRIIYYVYNNVRLGHLYVSISELNHRDGRLVSISYTRGQSKKFCHVTIKKRLIDAVFAWVEPRLYPVRVHWLTTIEEEGLESFDQIVDTVGTIHDWYDDTDDFFLERVRYNGSLFRSLSTSLTTKRYATEEYFNKYGFEMLEIGWQRIRDNWVIIYRMMR